MENNEERTFESFLDAVCEEIADVTWDKLKEYTDTHEIVDEILTEAAQRFGAWKARTTAIAFAELIRQNGFSSMGLGFDTWRKGPEGADRQYEFKTTDQLYDTFSGLPVEQGQNKQTGYTEIVKMIEGALDGNSEKVRRYANGFLQKFPDHMLCKPIKSLLEGNKNPDGLKLEGEQGQKADGWISVDDSLPAYGMNVLIFNTDGGIHICYRGLKKGMTDGEWRYGMTSSKYNMSHIEYWQPLPALPLQVNKDNNE